MPAKMLEDHFAEAWGFCGRAVLCIALLLRVY